MLAKIKKTLGTEKTKSTVLADKLTWKKGTNDVIIWDEEINEKTYLSCENTEIDEESFEGTNCDAKVCRMDGTKEVCDDLSKIDQYKVYNIENFEKTNKFGLDNEAVFEESF